MFFPHLLRAFEDVQVFWRATFNKATPTLVSNGVNLTRQLVQTSGAVLCRRGEIICPLTLEVLDDEVRERQEHLVKARLQHVDILLMHPILQYEVDCKCD